MGLLRDISCEGRFRLGSRRDRSKLAKGRVFVGPVSVLCIGCELVLLSRPGSRYWSERLPGLIEDGKDEKLTFDGTFL